jgi:hypothetical protein
VKQLKISLPDDLREKLDALISKSGNSLGEEIRQRLERSIEQDRIGPITLELATGVVNLAATMEAFLDAGLWHWHQQLHGIFAAAVAQRVRAYEPPIKGALALQRLAQKLGDAAASQLRQAPDALGAVIERADRRSHSYEYLQQLERDRAKLGGGVLSDVRKKEEDKSS